MRLLPGTLLLAGMLLASLAAGCSGSPSERDEPAATATPSATPAPTATPSSTPTPEATPAPSATRTPTATPSPSPTPSATPTASATTTPTAAPTPTATPSPTPDPRPARCAGLDERGAVLAGAVEEAMDGYTGGWGLALIDLDCDDAILVNRDHSQYPASAGKIVIAITALRAVQDGLLEFEGEVQLDVETVLSRSLDAHSDRLNDKVTSEQIAAVLQRAGTSEASKLEHSWRYAHFTPLDLARVWVSLVRGEQLDEELTAYLLDLATRPELGDGFWPFPPDFGVEGYVYGQKAGYWTSETPIGYRVSAGYARPEDGSSEGYVFAFLIRAEWQDLRGYWQRPVFPLVRDFIVGELEADVPDE